MQSARKKYGDNWNSCALLGGRQNDNIAMETAWRFIRKLGKGLLCHQ